MKKTLVIRADGNTTVGMGHVIRCLALADMLKHEFTITFAIQSPPISVLQIILPVTNNIIRLPETDDFEQDVLNFTEHLTDKDIVILDGYHFRTEYQKKIKNKGCKLVCIDDLHAWHQVADIIINYANGADRSKYSAEDYTQFYLGLDYVLLRKEFLNTAKSTRQISSLEKVFISMGAADSTNVTQKFVDALLQLDGVKEINLLLGDINPNLEMLKNKANQNSEKLKLHINLPAAGIAQLLINCDVSICPASTVSLESCAIGIVLVSGYTAENQLDNLKGMEECQTLINFGDLNALSIEEIQAKFQFFAAQPHLFKIILEHQRKVIDGKSQERLLAIFKML